MHTQVGTTFRIHWQLSEKKRNNCQTEILTQMGTFKQQTWTQLGDQLSVQKHIMMETQRSGQPNFLQPLFSASFELSHLKLLRQKFHVTEQEVLTPSQMLDNPSYNFPALVCMHSPHTCGPVSHAYVHSEQQYISPVNGIS